MAIAALEIRSDVPLERKTAPITIRFADKLNLARLGPARFTDIALIGPGSLLAAYLADLGEEKTQETVHPVGDFGGCTLSHHGNLMDSMPFVTLFQMTNALAEKPILTQPSFNPKIFTTPNNEKTPWNSSRIGGDVRLWRRLLDEPFDAILFG